MIRYNRIKKLLFIGLWISMFVGSIYGQDPVFSQFYNAPLHFNPAFAGNTLGPKIALNYRNQWPSVPWAYQSYNASYDQYFDKFNSGFGVSLFSDNAGQGILTTSNLGISYAYAIRLNRYHFIKIGIEPSLSHTRLNWQKLVFGDQINGETGEITPGGSNLPGTEIEPDRLNRTYIDVGVGGVYYNRIFYIGSSVKHLTAPDIQFIESGKSESIRGVPLRISAQAGAQFYTPGLNFKKYKAYVAPQILYVHQGPFDQLVIGGHLDIGVLSMGGWFRHAFQNASAMIATLGYEQDFFRIEYSYDIGISGLGNQGGAHELGIILSFEDRNRRINYNDCFEIFR